MFHNIVRPCPACDQPGSVLSGSAANLPIPHVSPAARKERQTYLSAL
jgi:hypothetical protein